MTPEKPPRLDFTFLLFRIELPQLYVIRGSKSLHARCPRQRRGEATRRAGPRVDTPSDLPHWREGGAARKNGSGNVGMSTCPLISRHFVLIRALQ